MLGMQLSACSVWETEAPEDAPDKNPVVEKRTVSGQPYFLPKGLIHLVITPIVPPDTPASTGTTAPTVTANGTVQLPTEGSATISQATPPPTAGGKDPGYTADFKLQYPKAAASPTPTPALPKLENHVTYKVIAEVKMVADKAAGIRYAHYLPNLLFTDNVALSTTPDGLLSAVTSTVEDRTPQILSNLEDTAVDLGEFAASGGFPDLGLPPIPDKAATNFRLLNTGLNQYQSRNFVGLYSTQRSTLRGSNDAEAEAKLRVARKTLFDYEEVARQVNVFLKAFSDLKDCNAQPDSLTVSGFYLKRLNIDETFDPFDPDDCARVQSLFADHTKGGEPPEYSPVKLVITPPVLQAPQTRGPTMTSQAGLCFREPTQVEIVLQTNQKYLSAVRGKVEPDQTAKDTITKLLSCKDNAAYLNTTAANILKLIETNETDLDKLWTSPPPLPMPSGDEEELEELDKQRTPGVSGRPNPTPKPNVTPKAGDSTATPPPIFGNPSNPGWDEDELKQELTALSKARQALLKAQPYLAHFGSDVDQKVAVITARYKSIRDQSYYGNLRGEVAGLGRFSLTIPNKLRTFALNVPRSAFVSRSMTLAIQNGMLLGFSHVKPSEVEGFSTIPLTFAEKLAAVPQSLFQAKNTTLEGQDSLIKSQTQLVGDQQALAAAIHPTPAPTAATPPPHPLFWIP